MLPSHHKMCCYHILQSAQTLHGENTRTTLDIASIQRHLIVIIIWLTLSSEVDLYCTKSVSHSRLRQWSSPHCTLLPNMSPSILRHSFHLIYAGVDLCMLPNMITMVAKVQCVKCRTVLLHLKRGHYDYAKTNILH